MNKLRHIQVAIAGAMPFLVAIDGFSAAVVYSILLFVSMTLISLFLFIFKNSGAVLKYPAAVILAFPFTMFAFHSLGARGVYMGWKPEIYAWLSVFSISGIYLGQMFKGIDGFQECFKSYINMLIVTVTMLIVTGAAVELFNDRAASFRTDIFSWPGPVIIFIAAVSALMRKVFEKLI